MKKKSKKKVLNAILFASFVILLSTWLGWSYISDSQKRDVKCYLGFDKDMCILRSIGKTTDVSLCNDIEDGSIQNYCYFEQDKCELIDDFITSYLCERLQLRPHMWLFFSNPVKLINADFYGYKGCSHLKGYSELHCIFRKAIKMSKQSLSQGIEVCNDFQEDLYKGECRFYILISFLSKYVEQDGDVELLLDFCDTIENRAWRSECFFTVADELSWQMGEKNYEIISLACDNSEKARDFGCFNHVAINLEPEEIFEFSEYVPEEWLFQIYDGLGQVYGLNARKNEIQERIKLCENEAVEDYDKCVHGLIVSIKTTDEEDLDPFFLEFCNSFDEEEHRQDCYVQYGHDAYFDSEKITELEEEIEPCKLVPEKHKFDCYEGFAWSLNIMTNSKISDSINICKQVTEDYVDYCFRELAHAYCKYVEGQPKEDIKKCELFPEKYRERCMFEFYWWYEERGIEIEDEEILRDKDKHYNEEIRKKYYDVPEES